MRRTAFVVVAAALVVAVALSLTGLSDDDAEGQAVTAVGTPASCADVLFIGADGNGERPTSTRTFGRTVQTLYREYVARAAGSRWSVQGHRVNFITSRTTTIKRTPHAWGLAPRVVNRASVRRWRVGSYAGILRTVGYLRQVGRACPQQQIVLVGYSQGASVLHRALLLLGQDNSILSRVTGVTLIGDGDRRSRSRASYLRGAPAARRAGAGVVARRLRPIPEVPARGWTLPVWQVCTRGDLVCDFGRTRVGAAISVHSSYWHGQGATVLRNLAAQSWTRTTKHPKPAEDLTTVSAEVSTAVRLRLAVDVAPGSLGHVRWQAQSALPPGLLLGPGGLLSGVPTTSGAWQVGYTVRSVESPEFSRQVPGRLAITVGTSRTGAISVGGGQSCSVRVDGTSWCWGRNNWGQLGDGTTTRSNVPVQVGKASTWATITTSGSTTCGLRTNHSLWCWGLNYRGQLGLGTTVRRIRPVQVGTALSWTTVSNSWFHTCATKSDGSLWCWGANGNGQLGDGTTRSRNSPVRVGTSADWVTVAAGGWHTCATKGDGSLWCWGNNSFGQLGTGDRRSTTSPVRVGAGNAWTAVSANWSHTCGVQSGGTVSCWGRNTNGQLGDGSRRGRLSPTPVAGGLSFNRVVAGDASSCGVASDGTTWCWGNNSYGQIGEGTRTVRPRPTQVKLPSAGIAVAVGWVHACAIQTDGSPVCWGSNEEGQLGDGSFYDALLPVKVR